MIEKLTLEDLKKMEPCDGYSKNDYAYARELFNGRDSLTYKDINNLQISCKDKIWVLFQMMSKKELLKLSRILMDSVCPFIKKNILYIKDKELGKDYLEALEEFNSVVHIDLDKKGLDKKDLENSIIKLHKIWAKFYPNNEFEDRNIANQVDDAIDMVNEISFFVDKCIDENIYYHENLFEVAICILNNGELVCPKWFFNIILDIFSQREAL